MGILGILSQVSSYWQHQCSHWTLFALFIFVVSKLPTGINELNQSGKVIIANYY